MLVVKAVSLKSALLLFIAVGASVVMTSPKAYSKEMGAADISACNALRLADFSGIQDAPSVIESVEVHEASDSMPAYCLVRGYSEPQMGFQLFLPSTPDWNGKFFESGIGGTGGSLSGEDGGYCKNAVIRGYACASFDTGHHGPGGQWAYHNVQAEFDYAIRSPHTAYLAGTAITTYYYEKKPKKSYFMGCSGGGRQALLLAQRFPWDFDGIISLDPGIRIPAVRGVGIMGLWNRRSLTDSNGNPLLTSDDIEMVHNAAIAQCDAVGDGIEDGVIGAPFNCHFDPEKLQCKKGEKKGCLTKPQVAALKKVYDGPKTSTGLRLGWGILPGSELRSLAYPPFSLLNAFYKNLMFSPDPARDWSVQNYDFDNDFKREGTMDAFISADSPNLHYFRENGGKLIITGDMSALVPTARMAVDYYDSVEAVMGGRDDTQEFARLFLIPGHYHCAMGPGVNAVDYVGYLERWVEQGQAPDMMVGAHVDYVDDAYFNAIQLPKDESRIKFTRPLYPFPLMYRYKGNGDPNDYRNFIPVNPTSN